jgi:hypothetical protein
VAVCRRSDSSDDQTGSLMASFQTKITLNICMLSYIQTKRNQLSPDIQQRPGYKSIVLKSKIS